MSADLSCGSKCAKGILFIFNFLIWLAGLGLLGVGIWFFVDPSLLQFLHIATLDTSESLVRGAIIAICVVGGVMFLTGFCGCCGALRESACMLNTYAVILVLLLLIQIAAGVVAVVFRNRIDSELDMSMNTTVQTRYGNEGQNGTTEAWDAMQVAFKCCGAIGGMSDWETSFWKTKNPTQSVPITCCVLSNSDPRDPKPVNVTQCQADANEGVATDTFVYHTGCKDSLESWVKEHAGILIGVAFGLALIQLLGIVIACQLRNRVRNGYEYV